MGGSGASLRANAVNPDADPNYRYHSTSFEALENIQYQGLKQSTRGQLGRGVYFAPTVEDTKGWTTENNEKVNLRIKTKTLNESYKYEDWTGEQGIARSKVRASDLEIKTADGRWIPLSESYIAWESRRRGIAHVYKKNW